MISNQSRATGDDDPRCLSLFRRRRIICFMARATCASSRDARATAVPVHAEPLAVVWERVASRPGGLEPEEIAQRRPKAVQPGPGHGAGAALGEIVESVLEPLQLLLVAVGVLSAIFGELRDTIAIFSVIVVVSAVEAVSEIRAKRALQALRELSAPYALVRRAGVAAGGRGRRAGHRRRAVGAGRQRHRGRRPRLRSRRPGHRRVQADRRGRWRPPRAPSRWTPPRRSPSGPACCTRARRWSAAPARASWSRSETTPRSGASAGWSPRSRSRPRRCRAR